MAVTVLLCSVLQGSGGSAVFCVEGQWRFCCVRCCRAVAILLCYVLQGTGGTAVFCVAGQWRFCCVLCCRAVAVLLCSVLQGSVGSAALQAVLHIYLTVVCGVAP